MTLTGDSCSTRGAWECLSQAGREREAVGFVGRLGMIGDEALEDAHSLVASERSVRRRAVERVPFDRPGPGHSAGYEDILWSFDCLVNRMDTLITSVGSATAPIRGSTAELLLAADIDAAMLRELVVGDIGGILIPMRLARAWPCGRRRTAGPAHGESTIPSPPRRDADLRNA